MQDNPTSTPPSTQDPTTSPRPPQPDAPQFSPGNGAFTSRSPSAERKQATPVGPSPKPEPKSEETLSPKPEEPPKVSTPKRSRSQGEKNKGPARRAVRQDKIYRTCSISEPHTRIRNAVINDPALQDDCLGVLVYLLSKPPDWIINPTEVANRFGYSLWTLQRRLNVLEECKYYWQHQLRNPAAKFTETERFVADDPAVRQICQTETERQICLAVKELAKSRGKTEADRTTKMSSDPHDKSPHAAKRRHTKDRFNNKVIKDSLNGSCAFGAEDIDAAAKAWSDLAARTGLPKIIRLTANRKKHLAARLKEDGLQSWLEALSRIEHSAFLCGENDRRWRVSFDWLTKSPDNFAKVLEGIYGNSRARTASAASDFDDEHWRQALQTYTQFGDWNTSQCGNRPGMPGCRVPKHLLKEVDL
ncbi:hypothetical protein MnTg02_01728 [bacterium MnTg02]|nr:hypothetical protein MnTg02_01728 [bacterium MnTg02]